MWGFAETVNNVLYESKLIGYPNPFRNKVRTFCQNPGGFVSQENYDDGLAVVNGHSYKEKKSENTNLAILCSHDFREPFDRPITYAQKIGELANIFSCSVSAISSTANEPGKTSWTGRMFVRRCPMPWRAISRARCRTEP